MTQKGERIEEESFMIIERSLRRIHPEEFLPVVKRVIHATGDFEYETLLRFHPLAIRKGTEAIRTGRDILVDVKMVEAGINRKLLEKFGCRIICNINEPQVEVIASSLNMTKAEVAMERVVSKDHDIGIVVVGNAPTALLITMELIEKRLLCPELVVGVPVGFVKAVESKEALSRKPYPFITCLGNKGGSSVAAAIVNALIKLANHLTN
jgi:precorrin-8X/cobalt-precorrin-8 methylmutase